VRVLVTRPEPGASATARRLTEMGYEPVVLPLTEIRTLKGEQEIQSGEFDAVAITSANAARQTEPEMIAALAAKPCFAVGDRTAEAAKEAGFRAVLAGHGDAAGLARLLTGRLRAGASVAYLCGRVRRPEFERALREAGFRVTPIETYDTVKRASAVTELQAGLGRAVDAALVYSVHGAEVLAELAARPELREAIGGLRYCCLSARIAKALSGIPPERVAVAREPSEEALLSMLRSG
jgi:uroporphyrinogen-III synthase